MSMIPNRDAAHSGLVLLFLLLFCPRPAPAESVLVPEIDGPWWDITGQPDLGALGTDTQEPVDFGLWQAGDITLQDHDDSGWFTLEELRGLQLAPADIPLLDYISLPQSGQP